MDQHGVRAVSGVSSDAVVSGVLCGLLRWRALRHERRVTGDGARVDPADLPQLVPAAISLRLRYVQVRAAMTSSTLISAFAEDVRHYLQLSPRQLPSMYLYDALGSALFDAICELPWYAITRGEMRLLERHRSEIFAHLHGLTRLVELGPGDGRKLKTLVEGTSEPLIGHLIDVSAGALERAAHTLSDALNLRVVTHQAPFEDGLDAIMRVEDDAIVHEESADRTLVLFLGSNIGNFDQRGSAALLTRIAASLGPGD